MPSEAVIREECVKRLRAEGWVPWWPKKSRHIGKGIELDIFGVYDVVAVKAGCFPKFIQLTDITNVSHRAKKVQDFLTKHDVWLASEIWGWNQKHQTFRIVVLGEH